MSEQRRKLEAAGGVPRQARPRTAVCPVTGVAIPECSCRRCVEELIRRHSPALLDRRFGNQRSGGRHAA